MRIVLAVFWLLTLCLPTIGAETVQRFDISARRPHRSVGALRGGGTPTRLEKDCDYDRRVDHWVTSITVTR